MRHESDACDQLLAAIVTIHAVTAATEHADKIVGTQLSEGRIDFIWNPQPIEPQPEVYENLVEAARPRLASYKSSHDRAQPSVAR
jgi:ABC-type phosphate/phosphonate transport system ATPase subunit